MDQLVLTTVSTIVVSTITSLVAVRLAMIRFRADKWWERKHESYTKLLRVLYRLVRYADVFLDHETGERRLDEEDKKRQQEEWRNISREYAEVRDLADFDLSVEAVKALEKYDAAKKAAVDEEDVFEWISADYDASKTCLAEIKAAARRDLRIRQRPAFWRKNS